MRSEVDTSLRELHATFCSELSERKDAGEIDGSTALIVSRALAEAFAGYEQAAREGRTTTPVLDAEHRAREIIRDLTT